MKNPKLKTYDISKIQTVYRRFHKNNLSVMYSDNDGYTWKFPSCDTGKWDIDQWIFCFIEQ